jgi:hypothetical protein
MDQWKIIETKKGGDPVEVYKTITHSKRQQTTTG